MNTEQQIDLYLAGQPEPKRTELRDLHHRIRHLAPHADLWFLDGRNEAGKVVSNPNIGYGTRTIRYANGTIRDFYSLGISANTTGISLYVMGIEDKNLLRETYGARLGKASVTGYCIKFRSIADIDLATLDEVVSFALAAR